MQVYLRNPLTGEKKKRKRGFSWTTLFFGAFVPLFRADWKFFGIGMLVVLASLFTAGIVGLVYWIVAAFKYNEWHLNGLRDKGFVEISQAEFYAVPVAAAV
jgi:hypothetical protein